MDAVTGLISEIFNVLLQNKSAVVVFLDVKSAYDNVRLDILRNIMIENSIPEYFMDAIWDAIWERIISFRGSHNLSDERTTRSGIPQGGPSSPPCFNLYFASISQGVRGRLLWYADNLTLIIYGEEKNLMAEDLTEQLNILYRNISNLGLDCSHSKSKLMLFTRKEINPSQTYWWITM